MHLLHLTHVPFDMQKSIKSERKVLLVDESQDQSS